MAWIPPSPMFMDPRDRAHYKRFVPETPWVKTCRATPVRSLSGDYIFGNMYKRKYGNLYGEKKTVYAKTEFDILKYYHEEN